MTAPLRIILCVPGKLPEGPELESLASAVKLEQTPSDPRVPGAFRLASRSWLPSIHEADHAAIAGHDNVTYAVSAAFTQDEAAVAAHHMLRVGTALLERGGAAIKVESAGLAHSAAYWKRLSERADKALAGMQALQAQDAPDQTKAALRSQFWLTLLDAYVQLPIAESRDMYSCGMHLLGQPEVVASTELVTSYVHANNLAERDRSAARLMMAFCHYLLAECPDGVMQDGQVFREGPDTPPFVVHRQAQGRYDEDEPFRNPFGEYRLELEQG